MVLPAQFPALPFTPQEFNWSPDVLRAHTIITTAYERASTLLRQEEGDPLRLRIHSEQVLDKLVPILEALEPEVGDYGWLEASASALGELTVQLQRSALVAEGIEHAKLQHVHPIRVERTGRRGRPRKVVEPVWLADAVASHRNITLQALADAMGMHRHTLRNYLKIGKRARSVSISNSTIISIDDEDDSPSGSPYLRPATSSFQYDPAHDPAFASIATFGTFGSASHATAPATASPAMPAGSSSAAGSSRSSGPTASAVSIGKRRSSSTAAPPASSSSSFPPLRASGPILRTYVPPPPREGLYVPEASSPWN
ncbi:hypothetical protein C8R47DRAFT_1082293 [Mycena vitilis]|nr:hypothetical protein C8R47DRAFT_1082293 [Mycena vitilis]